MAPKILDGRVVSQSILERLKTEISVLKKKPGLAVVLVGDNPASKAYVGMKQKACKDIGILSFEHVLPADVGEASLLALLQRLNEDAAVHGILLQLPLPKGYDEQKMLSVIRAEKDVDGFHAINLGKTLAGVPSLRSCTPYGVCELLRFYEIPTAGKHVVILGRSNIVGKPLAAMLMQKGADATVTVCHSRTPNLSQFTLQADILIAAMGAPGFVTADMVREGAVVVDVGTSRVEDANHPKGYRLAGDVRYDEVFPKAASITPVPGGVGPMTIAMLMNNTVEAYRALEIHKN